MYAVDVCSQIGHGNSADEEHKLHAVLFKLTVCTYQSHILLLNTAFHYGIFSMAYYWLFIVAYLLLVIHYCIFVIGYSLLHIHYFSLSLNCKIFLMDSFSCSVEDNMTTTMVFFPGIIQRRSSK